MVVSRGEGSWTSCVHSLGIGLSCQKLLLQKCPSKVTTSHLPVTLISHRSPFSWGAQLFVPVPAARYDADTQLEALSHKPGPAQLWELC